MQAAGSDLRPVVHRRHPAASCLVTRPRQVAASEYLPSEETSSVSPGGEAGNDAAVIMAPLCSRFGPEALQLQLQLQRDRRHYTRREHHGARLAFVAASFCVSSAQKAEWRRVGVFSHLDVVN